MIWPLPQLHYFISYMYIINIPHILKEFMHYVALFHQKNAAIPSILLTLYYFWCILFSGGVENVRNY